LTGCGQLTIQKNLQAQEEPGDIFIGTSQFTICYITIEPQKCFLVSSPQAGKKTPKPGFHEKTTIKTQQNQVLI